ncbi:2-oxo acid dehydrogenase subunit E2 [Nonomuraea sp. NPDC050536]|uniref:2-oxo acid dehydrogenase subunit E2 n=1 Tax=Nonomuraea sp. NPDC050536 TaxID=3364366 RepID=UPI0037C9476E
MSQWRKLADASWGAPRDPQFFGELDLDAATALAFIEEARRHSGVHVTMTHVIGRAVAHALSTVPELRVRRAFRGLRPRSSSDVFFIAVSDDGRELSGVKVADADHKSVVAVAEELQRRDPGLERGKALLARLPGWLLRPALALGAWLTSDLDLDLSRIGLPRQAFGGAMVSSVGMWGIDRAFSPLASYYRVPVLVLVGAVRMRSVAVAGDVVVRPMLTLTATFDHRYTDGFHAARFAAAIREYYADPAAFEPRALAIPQQQSA